MTGVQTCALPILSKVDIDFEAKFDEILDAPDTKYREISFQIDDEYRYLADFLQSWLNYDKESDEYAMKCFDIENLARSLLIFGNHILIAEPELIASRKLAAEAVLANYTE